jgi:hypothetical protein
MSQNMNIKDGSCCRSLTPGLRMLTLTNGAQVGVIGLDAVMEDLYAEGKIADETTVLEMIRRLEGNNYFSPFSRKTYEDLFLVEYRSFYEKITAQIKKENDPMTTNENNQNTKKKGIFNLFKGDKKAANEGGCCNMKIVPQDQPSKESSKGGCCNMKIVPKEQATEEKSSQK